MNIYFIFFERKRVGVGDNNEKGLNSWFYQFICLQLNTQTLISLNCILTWKQLFLDNK